MRSASAEAPQRAPSRAVQVGRFLVVGGSGALVNLALLAVLVRAFGLAPWLASLVAIEASMLWNHQWNSRWTWAERNAGASSLWRYHVVGAGGIAIQWGTVVIGAGFAGVHYLVAAALGIGLGTMWNFVGHDLFSFRVKPLIGATWEAHRWTLYAAVGALLVVGGLFLAHPWDTFVMQGSTDAFLADGTTPYETAREAPAYTYTGGSLPLVAQWYAYPPLPLLLMSATYWPVVAGVVEAPALARLLIKLPFLGATLGLAFAAHRFIASADGHETASAASAAARRTERLILLNPLVLIVAAVWGQFEALVLLGLIGMYAALRKPRWAAAGALWGLALLVKLLAVYLAPLLALHVWRRGGTRALVRFFGAASVVFGAMSLPFFLAEPGGFFQQVVGMHAGRPPARFAPFSALYYAMRWGADIGLAPRIPVPELASALSIASFLLTAAVVLAVLLASWRWPHDEPTLLWTSAMTMLGALLATKVLNEQYLVLPFGLLVLAWQHPASQSSPARLAHPRRLAVIGSTMVAIVAVADNLHFITFFPADVSETLFGADTGVAMTVFAWRLGSTVLQIRSIIDVVVGTFLVLVLIYAARALAPPLHRGLLATFDGWRPHLRMPSLPRESLIVPALMLMIAFPVMAVGLAPPAQPADADASATPHGLVLGLYDTRWNNPSNDPAQRLGPWGQTVLHPIEGYYTINARRAYDDLAGMRTMGADAVLISYDRYNEYGAYTAAQIADETGTKYALHVDLGQLGGASGKIPLTPNSVQSAARLIAGPGLMFWNGADLVRWGDTERPVLFLEGADSVGAALTDDEWRFVVEAAGGADAVTVPRPTDAEALEGDNALAAEWRRMYAAARAAWWDDVLRSAETPHDLTIVSDLAGSRVPTTTRADWIGVIGARAPAGGLFHAFPLADEPLDRHVAARAWGEAIRLDADAIIVPWNSHHEGRAMEPTHEHGDGLLAQATLWTEWYHEHRATAAQPQHS